MTNIECIKYNLSDIKHCISEAAKKAGTSENDIKMVAVTKYANLDQMNKLLDLGVTDLGENKVQTAVPKIEKLGDQVNWHFVGHLQSNKVKYLINYVDLIHSLDRKSLAKELDKRAKKDDIYVDALVQVNIAQDESKYGISPDQVTPFIDKTMNSYPNINIRGLMTMTPYYPDPEEIRPYYVKMTELFRKIKDEFEIDDFKYLSMGMSHDFPIAIEEGANLVRIGRAFFKSREEGN
ncbi:YggS family pyridoxal phosphate-dependent enzyme [Natranaerobius trueperi]|uniref:Pyridoxal phosphate homeostasis protein n=1 Tax=Natranaerobius trueperi TaxID=759412 RepID=A0A226BYP9_9FIRM|nr:YggS family pyridoxal phosphate-dependent enzyme [Natranaerobius trueperi]OWZ84143.1 YggS family pyridoxal phosphate-dependent enzyme [Natranaerobius trueperi]